MVCEGVNVFCVGMCGEMEFVVVYDLFEFEVLVSIGGFGVYGV